MVYAVILKQIKKTRNSVGMAVNFRLTMGGQAYFVHYRKQLKCKLIRIVVAELRDPLFVGYINLQIKNGYHPPPRHLTSSSSGILKLSMQ